LSHLGDEGLVPDRAPAEDPQAGAVDPVPRLATGASGGAAASHLLWDNLLGLAPGDQGVALVGVVGDHPVGPVKGLGEPAGGHRQLAGSLGIGDARTKASPRGISFGILGVVEHVDRVAPKALPGSQRVLGSDAEAPFGGGVKVLGLLVNCLVVVVVWRRNGIQSMKGGGIECISRTTTWSNIPSLKASRQDGRASQTSRDSQVAYLLYHGAEAYSVTLKSFTVVTFLQVWAVTDDGAVAAKTPASARIMFVDRVMVMRMVMMMLLLMR
jgi:hypothetical protein